MDEEKCVCMWERKRERERESVNVASGKMTIYRYSRSWGAMYSGIIPPLEWVRAKERSLFNRFESFSSDVRFGLRIFIV